MKLTISDVVYRGQGLGRADGQVVFVPDTLPGEEVEAEVVRQARNFAQARLVRVLQPSPARIAPACPLAGACPGCRYQHADYAEEVRLKQAQLANLLARMAGADPGLCLAPVAAPLDLGYRNKIGLHGAAQGDGRVLGYFAADNATVLDVPHCPLAVPPLNERLAELRADAAFMAAARDHLSVTLRWTAEDGALHWTGKAPAPRPWLTEVSGIGDVRVPRGSFFQVNPPVADALLAQFLAALADAPPDALVDLYCGVGVFALAAALAGVPRVAGVDADRAAIEAATLNAADRGLAGVRFRAGRAEARFREVARPLRGARWTLLVDPPRAGLAGAVLKEVAASGPVRLVYVSCAADTLARDIRRLGELGYRLRSARLLDMFPRTPYFETLAVLGRD